MNSQQLIVIVFSAASVFFAGISLVFSASVGHVNVIADRPAVPYGLPILVPMWLYHYVLPFLLAAFLQGVLWFTKPSSSPAVVLHVFVLAALACIWLTDLARHDRLLSLYQGILLIMALWPAKAICLSLKSALIVGAASLIVGVTSYGAVFAETRCEEISHVQCLTDAGPRNWVPHFLDQIGFSPFADFEEEDLRGVNLTGLDLRYANFINADLEGAKLTGANLRRAKMVGIKASKSNWRKAYLDGANISGGDLRSADLREVHGFRIDLSGANLTNADGRGASLSHANLAGSVLSGLRLDDAYLRFAENLELAQLSDACGNAKTRLPKGMSISPCG